MESEQKKIARRGKKIYLIPEGGSSPLGIWGYINFINELKENFDCKKINGVLTAAGSGGTTAAHAAAKGRIAAGREADQA